MPQPQSAQNHTRFDPAWHFFIAPVLLLNFFFAIYLTVRDRHTNLWHAFWWTIVSLALLLLAATTRGYALKNQDRTIRLEERVRLGSMLTQGEVSSLDDRQLIALRFASDKEVAQLARRAAAEKLDPKTIKQAIVTWRPDHKRV